jgi:methionine synthase / methylenetetrahydrofolate reductase(NADPH)
MSVLRAMLTDGRAHLMDGAMGTMLYERGIFLNVCYDELNRTRPDLVTSIHRAYLEAGAEILETNTFGANPVKLSAFRLEEHTEAINAAGVRCARQAVREWEASRAETGAGAPESPTTPCIVGAVGPLGLRVEPWGPTSFAEAKAFFQRQIKGLLEGGVDGFLLETFQDLGELEQAIAAVRASSDLPVMVQMTLADGGKTALGTPVARVVDTLDALGVDALGFNCSAGPAEVLEAVEEAAERTRIPILAQPNAGRPRSVGDRTIYLASPEYMARYARRMMEAGARFIGGCCGTTPEHIRELAAIVRADGAGASPRIQARAVAPPGAPEARADRARGTPGLTSSPLDRRIQEDLASLLASGAWIRCVECHPRAGWHPDGLMHEIRTLKETGADVIAIPDAPRGVARLPATMAAILAQSAVGIPALPHYTARDRILMDMVSDLLGIAGVGIRQVLLKSGDPSPTGPYPDPSQYADVDAIGLTHAVRRLSEGMEPGGHRIDPACPLLAGVRLNQVSPHPGRADDRYRYKVEAGAGFAVTQPVYEPETLWRFLERHPDHRIPVLAVIRPLTSLDEAEFLTNEVPGHVIPRRMRARLAQAEARGGEVAARVEGLEMAREILEALEAGAASMGLRGVYLVGSGKTSQVHDLLITLRDRERATEVDDASLA